MNWLERIRDWLNGRSEKDDRVFAAVEYTDHMRRQQEDILRRIRVNNDAIANAANELSAIMRRGSVHDRQ